MLLNIANISEKTAYFYLFFDDLKNGLKLIKHNKTNQMDFHNEKINKFRVYYRKWLETRQFGLKNNKLWNMITTVKIKLFFYKVQWTWTTGIVMNQFSFNKLILKPVVKFYAL